MFITGRIAITAPGAVTTAGGVTDEKDLNDQVNVIFLRPKMDFGTRNKVVGEAAKIVQRKTSVGNRAQRRAARGKDRREKNEVEFDVGAYQTALLVHNVLGWAGPAFKGFACTPENIAALDPDEALVKLAIDEITNRNAGEDADEDTLELDDPNVIEATATTIS